MGAIPNTIRRGGVYNFRKAVPAALRSRLARGELTCSLGTHDAGAARKLSRCLYLLSEELFGVLESEPMLSDDDIAALVKDFYRTIIGQDDSRRLLSDLPDVYHAERAEHYRQLAERARQDLGSNAFGSVRQISAVMLARRYGLEAKFDNLSVRKVQQAMLRAGFEVAQTLRAGAEGDFNYEPGDKLLVAALTDLVRSDAVPALTSIVADTRPQEPAGRVFSIEAEAFRETQLNPVPPAWSAGPTF